MYQIGAVWKQVYEWTRAGLTMLEYESGFCLTLKKYKEYESGCCPKLIKLKGLSMYINL